MEGIAMANTFDWIEIRTNDIERIAAFYQALFGWTVTDRETAAGSPVWIFDTGGEPRIENLRRGGIWLKPAGEQQGFVIYVHVDDIEQTLQRVRELGGTTTVPKIQVGAGQAAFFTDPCGNLLGIYEDPHIDR
jgi:uncharacterized protein